MADIDLTVEIKDDKVWFALGDDELVPLGEQEVAYIFANFLTNYLPRLVEQMVEEERDGT
jgi:hypothetical protein